MAASKQKFIWSTNKLKKIKIREVREFSITYDDILRIYSVSAFGFFGGPVKILETDNIEECQEFIDSLTDTKEEVDGNVALQQT